MKQKKLSNGLHLLLFEDKKKHSTLVNFVTDFGGIDSGYIIDGKKHTIRNGMAHFLEHLLIESSPYGNLMRVFGEMQMNTNGSTYPNRTEYYFNAVERLEEALPILIKAIDNASFTKEDVEKVKGAIYEEIRRGEDDRGKRLFTLRNECLFKNIPYYNTIGTLEDVESFTFEEVKACYETFYTLSNQYLVIAGNFDEDAIIEQVEEICKSLPNRNNKVEKVHIKEPIKVNKKRGTTLMPIGNPFFQLCYKIDVSRYTPEERLELDYYMHYFCRMNFGSVSTCNQELQREKIIIGGVSFSTFVIEDFFLVAIGAHIVENKEKIFEKKIQSILENPIYDQSLFDLYQNENKIDIALREERIGATVFPFLENLFTFLYPYPDTIEQLLSYSFSKFEKKMKELPFTEYSVCCIKNNTE